MSRVNTQTLFHWYLNKIFSFLGVDDAFDEEPLVPFDEDGYPLDDDDPFVDPLDGEDDDEIITESEIDEIDDVDDLDLSIDDDDLFLEDDELF